MGSRGLLSPGPWLPSSLHRVRSPRADRRFLQRAIQVSRRALEDDGKTPFGALVVIGGQVVGEGTGRVVELHDLIAPLRDRGCVTGSRLVHGREAPRRGARRAAGSRSSCASSRARGDPIRW